MSNPPRAELFRLQGGRCAFCAKPMDSMPCSKKQGGVVEYPNGYTADHVQPRWKGRTRTANVLLMHLKCNARKGARSPTEEEETFAHLLHCRISIAPLLALKAMTPNARAGAPSGPLSMEGDDAKEMATVNSVHPSASQGAAEWALQASGE